MTRNGIALFVGLGLIGAVSGLILGELYLGRGRGLTVAPLSALVGLLLAGSLWKTRPRPVNAEPPPAPVAAPPRRAQRQPSKVRVAKSQQGTKSQQQSQQQGRKQR